MVQSEIDRAAARVHANRTRDFKTALGTLSMFSGFLLVHECRVFSHRPSVSINVSTYRIIDFRSETQPVGAIFNYFLNTRWVEIIERPLRMSPRRVLVLLMSPLARNVQETLGCAFSNSFNLTLGGQ